MTDLAALRQKIDSIDTTLVGILNERAKVSIDIGAAKKNNLVEKHGDNDVQVYRPSREKEVYQKLTLLNDGPLTDKSLHGIFREIMSASIALQKDISVSHLGSRGSFSYQAAYECFGDCAAFVSQKRIDDIFKSVERGHSTYGIVPFENSIFGSVAETLDRFIRTSLKIRAETYLPIHQCLLSNSKLEEITKVYSHPQAFGEAYKWLNEHVPQALQIAVNSTTEAAEKAEKEPNAAAVCSEICSQLYELEIVGRNIDDTADNTTRFLIIGSASDLPTGDDHTIIKFSVNNHQPDALSDAIKVFKDNSINLFKIDSRPSGRPWYYTFFIECSGHYKCDKVEKSIRELENFCSDIVVLGSFPSQK